MEAISKVYDNRELSWLKFNERVLEEAQDESVPLFERLRFVSIFSSNLDEFFMVRVGSLYDQMLVAPDKAENKTNMTPEEQLSEIARRVSHLLSLKDQAFTAIMNNFSDFATRVMPSDLQGDDRLFMSLFFEREVMPMLSPGVIDKNHPFPFLKNKQMYIGALLRKKSEDLKKKQIIGIVTAEFGANMPRILFLPGEKLRFVLVEDIILHYIENIFTNYYVESRCVFRITRNADIDANEGLYDQDMDFRAVMEELCKKRKKLTPVRAEFSYEASYELVKRILSYLELDEKYSFRQSCPLDMDFLSELEDKVSGHKELFYEPVTPQYSPMINPGESMFAQLSRKDILLSYPYNKFKGYMQLLSEAADDPYVTSIKITLYRVARDSEIVSALIRAAENGKQVLALVELRARFDEENNIGWSKKMEEAGVKIIYGLEALKVHSKLMLITRKTGNTLKYFTQIGTGNYNERTSKLYTDFTLMTSDRSIGADASVVFNALSLGTTVESTNCLLVAPRCLKSHIVEMIDNEIIYGEKGYIGLKLNSLTDKDIIDKLIEASGRGVKIELLIRGICCLVAGVEGVTDNITVHSIVGRFLEHSRIYIFGKEERRRVFISSADFMTRNTERRVEVAVPLKDSRIADTVAGIFDDMYKDNVKTRIQDNDGIYRRVKRLPDEEPFEVHKVFYERAYKEGEQVQKQSKAPKKSFLQRLKEKFAK